MKSRAVRALGVAGAAALLLLMPAALLADGQDSEGTSAESVGGLAPDIPEVFVPATEEAPLGVLPSPYTLLTPIKGLLSGSVWAMVTGLDPRAQRVLTSRTQRSGLSGPGLAWESLREVFTAPTAPPIAHSISARLLLDIVPGAGGCRWAPICHPSEQQRLGRVRGTT